MVHEHELKKKAHTHAVASLVMLAQTGNHRYECISIEPEGK